jgi:hypothetical protein
VSTIISPETHKITLGNKSNGISTLQVMLNNLTLTRSK